MKVIHRLVIKSYLGPLVLSTFIVLFILVMNFVWRYIDELVGKGLSGDVIMELVFYVSINALPEALPLSILLSAIITMGDMGENYELLAMKSSGMSLMSILKPMIVIVGMISVGSFFIANDLVPYTTRKMNSILYDIGKQKQTIEFKDGVFFNGIENMSIRVETQNPETNLLKNIIIYDNRDHRGDMITTVADSGYIKISDDSKSLQVTLYNGSVYEQARNRNWLKTNEMTHRIFSLSKATIALEGFALGSTDESLFAGSYSKGIGELDTHIDSLQLVANKKNAESYEPFLIKYMFPHNNALISDSLKLMDTVTLRKKVYFLDSIAKMDLTSSKRLWEVAKKNGYNSKSAFTREEGGAKGVIDQLYRHQVDWHKKILLPVSIIVFLLIGAPLGAIIRKGGLGMPILVSIFFFVIYYMVSMTGVKLTKEGTWIAYFGMWLPMFVLIPISIFLTYKATNDSNLFNADKYIVLYIKGKEEFIKMINKGLKIWNNRKN